jgi:hypothetical protein
MTSVFTQSIENTVVFLVPVAINKTPYIDRYCLSQVIQAKVIKVNDDSILINVYNNSYDSKALIDHKAGPNRLTHYKAGFGLHSSYEVYLSEDALKIEDLKTKQG